MWLKNKIFNRSRVVSRKNPLILIFEFIEENITIELVDNEILF
jgi:hypothetical protein